MGIDFTSAVDLQQSGVDRLIGAGAMLAPNTPSFSVWGTIGSITEGNWIVYPDVIYNVGGGSYNTGNGIYTAPVAGVYYFFGYFLAESSYGGEYRQSLYKNSAMYSGGIYIQAKGTDAYFTMCCGGHMHMAAGDYIGLIRIATGTGGSHNNGYFYAFGGYLVA